MKTLYRYTDPKGFAKVRLVKRQTFVPPATQGAYDGGERKTETSFAVILDVTGEFAAFDNFSDIGYAASAFALLCDRFGGVTGPNQVVAL